MTASNWVLLAFMLASCQLIELVTSASLKRPDCRSLETGTFLPDPSSAMRYYICVNGKAKLYRCPVGFSYDSEESMCVLNGNGLRRKTNRDPNKVVDPAPTTPCAPAPTTPCAPAPTTPCAPAPTTPCAPAPTTPCAQAPTTPCAPARATPCASAPTTPCAPAPTTPCAPAPTTPCAPAPTTPCAPAPIASAPCTPPATPCSQKPPPSTKPCTPTPAPCTQTPTRPPCTPTPAPCTQTPPPCTTTASTCSPPPCTTTKAGDGKTDPLIRYEYHTRKDCQYLDNGIFLVHPKHCRRYYVCSDRKVKARRCRNNEWFDFELGQCRNSGDVKNCPANRS